MKNSVMFQPINFSKFATNERVKSKNSNVLRIANVYGIIVGYIEETNEFGLRYLSSMYTKNKRTIEKVRKCQEFKSYLAAGGLDTSDIYVHERNSLAVVDSRLFWPMMLWLNMYEFTKAFLKMCFGNDFDFDTMNIPYQFKSQGTSIHGNYEWLGLTVEGHIPTGYLSYSKALFQIEERFHMKIHTGLETHKRSGETINRAINAWKEVSHKEPFLRESEDTSKENSKNTNRNEHPNALYLYVLNTYPLELVSITEEIYRKRLAGSEKLKSYYQFNLEDEMVNDIDENFALGLHDDYIIKFHKPTNYINIAYTAKTIDEAKWNDHSQRFWQADKTCRILKLLSNDIINSLDIDDETKKSRIQKVNENTLIPSTCDNTKSVEEQLQEHPTFIVFNNSFSKKTRGCYVHPDLFIFALMWMSDYYTLRYIRFINALCHGAARMNERIEELVKQVTELKGQLIQLEYLKGSVKFKFRDDDNVKVQSEKYEQVCGEDDFVYAGYDSVHIKNKVYEYIKAGKSHFLTITDKKHSFKIVNDDVSRTQIIEEIKRIIRSKEIVASFEFNVQEYALRRARYVMERSVQSYGFLFESEMSRKYNAFLYKDIPELCMQEFGLDHKDTGIDLVDLKNKILYQCKCYTTTKLTLTDSLKRSLKMLKKFQSIDPDYQLKFIFNEGIDVDQEVLDIHVPILYEQTTLEETLHVSIEEALRATLDAFVDDEDDSDDVIEEEEEQEEINEDEDGFGITINDYIQQHIDEKADDLITFINANISKFIDGVKPLTKQAFWTRKCRIKNGRR